MPAFPEHELPTENLCYGSISFIRERALSPLMKRNKTPNFPYVHSQFPYHTKFLSLHTLGTK